MDSVGAGIARVLAVFVGIVALISLIIGASIFWGIDTFMDRKKNPDYIITTYKLEPEKQVIVTDGTKVDTTYYYKRPE